MLFEKLKAEQSAESESNLFKYNKLITTIDIGKPTDADTKKLSKLLGALGKTLADAEADYRWVAELREALATIEQHKDVKERVDATYAAQQEAYAERQRVHHEQTAKILRANEEHNQANVDDDQRRKMINKRDELSQANPDLFAAVVGEGK